ncbi:uncharacterized protein LOC106152014 isoform X3 [Lingula anatina]|uniref:Uncharacterized protein LOC106152014 isoform X3 n=1 Tax=Lingula anatina TaxID=7574 RepID=A0A1S3H622_LINAN|nr:uncharacterized protein LOC106152014 isoform X3 [Lingula anatina]|eukprot:XP_013380926.1 uncharacterized protein LOC106152014 isoform X3 [Lingula anatina]
MKSVRLSVQYHALSPMVNKGQHGRHGYLPKLIFLGVCCASFAGDRPEHFRGEKSLKMEGQGLKTTVVGSYPKPDYLKIPDWFKTKIPNYSARMYNQYSAEEAKECEESLKRALKECMEEQSSLGIDVITDGETRRENYIYPFCRALKNFSFTELTFKVYRNGATKNHVPTVIGPLEPASADPWCAKEWQESQAMTKTPVKYTMPGPMTIMGSTANKYYKTEKDWSEALVKLVNREVRALAAAGCKYIQIDEPVMVRSPEIAMDYGIDHLTRCFEGVGPEVEKTVHLCCGYPAYLDQTDYMKADRSIYMNLAEKLDNSGLDAFSIEDAHQHNDLTLLEKFKKTKVIFGVVAIAKSRVETVEEIKSRVMEALKHIPKERLILAPDCGLAFLPRDILRQKLSNMVAAAKSVV